MRNRLLSSALACALCVAGGMAGAVPDTEFQRAFDQFTQARSGNASPQDAALAFATLSAQEPANPVLLVYRGAATAMQARDALMPWKKMGYADDGLALIDKALAMLGAQHDTPGQRGTPASLEVKLTAASTFLAMPRMMNRHGRGEKLLTEVLASPLLNEAPLSFRAQVWLAAADEADRSGQAAQARRFLEQVVQSGAPQATQAQVRLQGVK